MLRRFCAALLAASAAATAGDAQPRAERDVRGSVHLDRATGEQPVAGVWVTLHRVAGDSSGPLDSVRTDGQGGYRFRFRPFGAEDAIYFASVRYGGVAYFTTSLSENAGPDVTRIDVFDTTSAAMPVSLRGRHVIVAAPDTRGARQIIEVYEISNDSSLTMVELDGTPAGTWSTSVPRDGEKFQVRSGEVPPDAVQFAPGRVVLHMPFAPGLKQVAFSYQLPASAFPLRVTAPTATSVLEVLVEDSRGTVTGPKVTPVAAVAAEGRSFRRFLAQDVPAAAVVAVDLPAPIPSWTRWVVPGVLVVTGLGMAGALLSSRRRRGDVPPVATGDDVERIAREIAALDDAAVRGTADSAYERRRAELKAELSAALRR